MAKGAMMRAAWQGVGAVIGQAIAVFLALMALALAQPVAAQTGIADPAAVPTPAPALPRGELEDLRADAVEMIHAYGRDGGLTPLQAERAVAVAGAAAAARTVQRLTTADLDLDGAISGEEAAIHMDTLSAWARGRFGVAFGRADGDADGVLSAADVDAARLAAAAGAMPQGSRQLLAWVLAQDADGDGRTTPAEVEAAIEAHRAAAAAKEI